MLNPTYADYATHDESQFPELWEGTVFSAAPCLGATGLRLFDTSRRNNWGVLTGMDAATDWVVSGGQMALDFDGTDDWVNIPNSTQYDVGARYTLSIWMNARSLHVGGMLTKSRLADGSWFLGYWNDGRVLFQVNNTTNFFSTGTLAIDRWNHVAITPTAIYFNGVLDSTGTYGTLNSTIADLRLGNRQFNNDLQFNGQLDDARLYNRALTPAEIRLLATRRGIAYQRRKRRYAPAQQATGRRRRLLLTGQT